MATESDTALVAGDDSESGGAVAETQRPSTLAASAAGSTIWNVVAQIVQTLIGFAAAGFLTRWLRPDDYGTFSIATTVISFVGIFSDAGLISTLVRRPHLDQATQTTAFGVALAGGTVLTVMSIGAAPILGFYFGRRDVAVMSAIAGFTFLISAPGRVSTAKISRDLRFVALSIAGTIASLISQTICVVLAISGAGAWSLVASFMAAPALLTSMYLFLSPPRVKIDLFSRSLAKELSAFGAKLSGFTLAVAVAWFPLNFLMGRFAGFKAIGLFSMAMKLVFFPAVKLGGAFSDVFLPAIAQFPSAERHRAYRKTLTMLVLCTAPALWGLVAVADELVVLLPASWAGIVPPLRAVAVGSLFLSVGTLATHLLTADGRSGTILVLGVFMIPLAWGGLAIASWIGGLWAFVVAWSAINIVGCLLFLGVAARSVREMLKDIGAIAGPLLAAALMAAGVRSILVLTGTRDRSTGLFVGIATGLILYTLFAWILAREDMRRGLRLVRAALIRR
jgi:PST family polysaccharide transporter